MLSSKFLGSHCLWCRVELSSLEKYRCTSKGINVVQRGKGFYGVCLACLEVALTLERSLYPAQSIPATVDHFERTIRCCYCGSKLNIDEKRRHFLENECYALVRGCLRGRCYDCTKDGARTKYP
ncbi:protein E6 [Ovis aries papillomavirus type 4]|nr:protein E6 [Ovis aries papillomavirus type 4]